MKGALKCVACFVWKYVRILWTWLVKFARMRVWKWKLCGARKEMDSCAGRLGVEIYSLYKQGETDWQKSPFVQQQLKLVEQAETALFAVQDAIEQIESEYREKRQAIAEHCTECPGKQAEEEEGRGSSEL